jgi:hypothetical protein
VWIIKKDDSVTILISDLRRKLKALFPIEGDPIVPVTGGSSTLRVTMSDRNGSGQVAFTREVPIAGSPDRVNFYSYQIDPDIRRRGYFDDLRIDSSVEGGGHLPNTIVHVRKTLNGPSAGGNITLSSEGQELAVVSVNEQSGGGNSYDSWAQFHQLDPMDSGTFGADPDGDGYSNLHEFLFGGNPTQGQGALFSSSHTQSGLVLTFHALDSSGSYSLMATSNLVSGPWLTEQVVISEAIDQSGVPTGYKRRQITIPAPTGNRFYRIQADISE